MAIENKIVNFVAEADFTQYNKEVKDATKAQTRQQKTVTKGVQTLDKAQRTLGKDLGKYETAVKKAFKTEEKRTHFLLSHSAKVEEFEKMLLTATQSETEAIRKSQDVLEKKYKLAMAGATGYMKEMVKIRDATDDLRKTEEQRAIDQIAEIKDAKRLLTIREAIADMHKRSEDRKSQKLMETAGYGGHEMGEDIGDSIKDALHSISSRDFAGMAKGVAGMLVSAGKGLRGGAMRAEATKAGGGGGGMLASIAPVLKTLGPIVTALGAASSALMVIVKLFLDADAAAKEFNKSVLDTTATSGYLEKNLGDVDLAAEDLASTMKEMFTQATAWDNINWGISKETHSQIEAALGAQGVQTEKLAEYFKAVKEGRVESQGMVKDWGDMVHMSVAYSRLFGVSMSEITDITGEMMTDFAMGADSVEASFEQMRESAGAANIGAGKFFAQMRSIASDISLFNFRMGDAAKLMGQLDKSMNPKKAAEMMGTLTGLFKGMSVLDKAKIVLQVGTKTTKDVLQKDLANSTEAMAKDLEALPDLGPTLGAEFRKELGKGGSLIKFLTKNGKKLNGEQVGAITKMAQQQQKLDRGGYLDVADAMEDASPIGAVEIMSKLLGKPLRDMSAMDKITLAAKSGKDEDTIEKLKTLDTSFNISKEAIVGKLADGEKLTEEEANMMGKLKISYKDGVKDINAANALHTKDSIEVFDAMGKTQQQLLASAKPAETAAEKQGRLTTSINDQLGVIMEFLLGAFYNAVMGLYSTIKEWLGKGNPEEEEMQKLTRKAVADGDKELLKAIRQSGGSLDTLKGILQKGQDAAGGGSPNPHIDAVNDAIDDVAKKIESAKTEDLTAHVVEAAIGSVIPGFSVLAGVVDAVIPGFNVLAKVIDAVTPGFHTLTKVVGGVKSWLGGGGPAPTERQPTSFSRDGGPAPTERQPTSFSRDTEATPSPAQAAGVPSSAQPVTPKDMQEATDQQGDNIQSSMDDLARTLKQKSGGIVFNGPYLKNQYGRQMEDSVYNAASRALFEFWMYQGTNKEDAVKALKAGVGVRDMGASFLAERVKGAPDSEGWNKAATTQSDATKARQPHADGGVVARPAPGEMFASVKAGERIIPAGGGSGQGSTITLELKGDLKRIIRAEAHNAINEAQRAAPRR